ncbi:MAG TPA: hypothetical protein VFB31_18425 [Pseudolabrys sp.]|nr:hypothetical protein [Pseudolabrys sp.]
MSRRLLTAISLVLALGLSGCGVGPGVTGNSTGGIIPWTPVNQANARAYADQHCAAYDKVAVHVVSYAEPGQYISFDCQFTSFGYRGR